MKNFRPQVEWKDSYRIGIPLLDAEHKNLFLAINTYIDSIHLGRGIKFSQTVIDTIVDYAKTHFKREESLMLEHATQIWPSISETTTSSLLMWLIIKSCNWVDLVLTRNSGASLENGLQIMKLMKMLR